VKDFKSIVTVLAIGSVIVGCGGGGGNPPQQTPDNTPPSNNGGNQNQKLSSGKVSDGYIANANVLIDINTTNIGEYDRGDWLGKTDTDGNFAVPTNLAIPDKTFIYAKGGKNVATGEDFNGTLKAVYTKGSLSIMLTPLSTMVAVKVENNVDLEKATEQVAKAMGIPEDKVNADPAKDKDALKATQKIVAISKVIATVKNTNMTDAITEIAKNLDSNLTKAVKKSVDDKELADTAIKTGDLVEQVITKDLSDSNNLSVENVVNKNITNEVVKAVKNGKNTETVLKTAKNKIDSIKSLLPVAKCLTFDKIKGSNKSDKYVVSPIDFKGAKGCSKDNIGISWFKASKNVNLSTGAVIRDNYKNKLGFVEANITNQNNNFMTKPIYFTVIAKGHIPTLKPDLAKTKANESITIDVLSNDTDIDGDSLTIKSVSTPAHGKAVVKNNKIVYTPDSDYTGKDFFEYTVKDPLGAEVKTKVVVTIIPTAVAKALEEIDTFNPQTDDINELVSKVQQITQNSKDNDAQVIYEITLLAQTFNNLDDIIEIGGDNNILEALVQKKKGIDLTEAVDDLSDIASNDLNAIAKELKEVSAKLDAMYKDNPKFVFRYKNFSLNKNDAIGVSGTLKLLASKLEYISAYNVVKADYIKRKIKVIDDVEYEYREIKVNPKVTLNDKTTLSLRDDAQTSMDTAKQDFINAIKQLAIFDSSNSKLPFSLVKNIRKIQPKIKMISDSLSNKGSYIVNSGNKTFYINLSALYDASKAPTLSTILGNNFSYKIDCGEENGKYSLDKSIVENTPIGICSFGINKAKIIPNNIPKENNRLPLIINKIKVGDKLYKGNDILKVLTNK